LTGGGDTPSLNSTLYAIVKAAEDQDGEVLCFRRGWAGGLYPDKEYYVKVEKNGKLRLEKLRESTGEYVFLNSKDINPDQGGSIILSSRTNLEAIEGALEDFSRRPARIGCCLSNECINSAGACIRQNTFYTNKWVCGSSNECHPYYGTGCQSWFRCSETSDVGIRRGDYRCTVFDGVYGWQRVI